MAQKEALNGQLNNVLRRIAIDPGNHAELERLGWEDFIAHHHGYVMHEYGIAMSVAQDGREALEGMPVHKQKLAGAIIRATFSNVEIEEYGRQEI